MQNTVTKTMSWGWIIFWFILFWPIGIILLFKKLSCDKTATLKNAKTVAVISYILIGIGAFYLLLSFSEGSSFITAAILFGGGGIWVNRIAKKMKTTGERYKKYIAMVVNQSQTSIDSIASAVGVPYEVAAKDLQKMIDAGYFFGAYIDVAGREIVLAKAAPAQVSQPSAVPVQERVVACGSCGANNKVAGQVGECEYCGSPLQ